MNTQENRTNTSETNQYHQEDSKIVELREAIYEGLGSESGVDLDIDKNGCVWLSGTVDDEASRERVVSTIEGMTGVKEVIDNMTLKVVV